MKRNTGLVSTILIICLASLSVRAVKAELEIPIVSVHPSRMVVSVGQIFEVDIAISNLDAGWRMVGVKLSFYTGGYEPELSWDHVVVGSFWAQFGYTYSYFSIIEPPHPWYPVVQTILLPDSETGNYTAFPAGNGTLYTLTFSAYRVGNATIWPNPDHPYGYLLYDVQGEEIPCTVLGASVEVREPLLGDLNLDNKIDIQDLAIGALAFGSFPGHPRWNPAADVNEDDKIDVKDLAQIASNFGKAY